MRKVALIYNPASGTRFSRHRAAVQKALAVLRDFGVNAEAFETRGPGTAVGIARQAVHDGFDTVLACGGDGTVNEVLQSLVGTEVALGVLPLGTANALAANLGLLGSPARAARSLTGATPQRVSVGRIHYQDEHGVPSSRYFTVAAGIGADAIFLSRMDPSLKRRLGYLLYIIEGFRVWATHSFPLFDASFVNGAGVPRVERVSQILAIRVRSFGGVLSHFAPGATLHSHGLHLIVFKTRLRLHYFRFLLAVVFRRHTFSSHVELIHADSVECRPCPSSTQKIFAEVDGDLLGTLPVRIEIVPDAVILLIPPEAQP
jgi:YegS/Rv2252/BmrU family lipid kinase